MNLRDLSDDDLLCDLIGGTFTATHAAELSRRLSNLRKNLSEALVGWDETCDKLDAAEADRDRLLLIRERVEKYLTENGWTQRDLFWSLDGFDLDGMLPMRLGHALDIQLARDASKEASK